MKIPLRSKALPIDAMAPNRSQVPGCDHRLQTEDDKIGLFSAQGHIVSEDRELDLGGQLADIRTFEGAQRASIDDTRTYHEIFAHMLNGLSYCRMIFDGDRPADFIYLYVNPAFETQTGMREVVGRKVSDVVPGIAQRDPELFARYGRVARHGTPEVFEYYVSSLQQWFSVSAFSPAADHFVSIFDVITDRKLDALALRAKEQQLARVIDGSEQGFWDWNLQTNQFSVSARWEAMLGFAPGEMNVATDNWPQLVHPQDLPVALASIQQHLEGLTPNHRVEFRARTKEGGWRWILTQGRVVERDAAGRPLMMSGTHTDITDRKIAELAMREAATVFTSSYEGIMVVDVNGRVTRVNPSFTRITGYAPEDIVGQSPRLLSANRHDPDFYVRLWDAVRSTGGWSGEIWNRRKNGEVYPESLSIAAVLDGAGEVMHYVGVFSDIGHLKKHEAELDRIANFDTLTGVPNRRLLADRLSQAIVHADRNGAMLAVCYLDLDAFKAINDSYGHVSGDQLLVAVTEYLTHILRAGDTLARLGGDEFVLLLTDIVSLDQCRIVLDRVLAIATQPFLIGDAVLKTSVSVGVCLYPDDRADADTLLRHADQAMYIAKESGRNRYAFFDPAGEVKEQQQRQFIDRLDQALARDEFVLYYQPQVNLTTGAIVGVEALIRWQHPERGLLAPVEFLPFVDGSRLVKPLGEWVIEAALAQAAIWQAYHTDLCVGVNVSAGHLLEPGFFERLEMALVRHPEVHAGNFEIEVLETTELANMNLAVDVVRRCRDLGVQFALDDFGTGFSSLTYLRQLPVHRLKIDQSFVRDMLTDPEDLGIVKGVIQLAGALDRRVVAEGVETLQHGAALIGLGCPVVQGYGIARPMPAHEFLPWTRKWKQTWPGLVAPMDEHFD